MEQMIPKRPVRKAWPPMTPGERPAVWEEARLAWTHDAKGVIAGIERGQDEADRSKSLNPSDVPAMVPS